MNPLYQLWLKINEPRIVSVTHAAVYFVLMSAGIYALVDAPNSVEGQAGDLAMMLLAGTLAVGGAIGVPTSLAGIWWLERTAVALVLLASGVYLGIIIALQLTSESGNRWLQAGFVFSVLALHLVRWHRVRQRPYDPDRVITPA